MFGWNLPCSLFMRTDRSDYSVEKGFSHSVWNKNNFRRRKKRITILTILNKCLCHSHWVCEQMRIKREWAGTYFTKKARENFSKNICAFVSEIFSWNLLLNVKYEQIMGMFEKFSQSKLQVCDFLTESLKAREPLVISWGARNYEIFSV